MTTQEEIQRVLELSEQRITTSAERRELRTLAPRLARKLERAMDALRYAQECLTETHTQPLRDGSCLTCYIAAELPEIEAVE